jgi:hypothetical protein
MYFKNGKKKKKEKKKEKAKAQKTKVVDRLFNLRTLK